MTIQSILLNGRTLLAIILGIFVFLKHYSPKTEFKWSIKSTLLTILIFIISMHITLLFLIEMPIIETISYYLNSTSVLVLTIIMMGSGVISESIGFSKKKKANLL